MKNSKFILIFVFMSLFNFLQSQDFHYSQFNENPSLVNPALVGSSHVFRASLVYKDQWRSVTTPYSTFGVSIDAKIKPRNWEKVDAKRGMIFKKASSRTAGGLSVYNDLAGDGRLGTLQVNLSYAMSFPLTNLSSLTFGLQGSLVQRKVDNSKIIYSVQYNGSGYDINLPSGEPYARQSFLYPDFGGGALWSYGHNEKSIAANTTVYQNSKAFSEKLPDYFRIDFGVSFRRNLRKYSWEFSFDAQNIINRENVAQRIYNPEKKAIEVKKNIGIIPVFTWKLEFGI